MAIRCPTHTLAVAALLVTPCAATAQCPDGTPPPCARRPAMAAVAPASVAVLYFANRSRDSADTYLADGLTEEIIARLARVDMIEVKSRTAVARFRNGAPPDSLGRALRVANLVSGTIQRSGRRLRVSVELVRASNGVTSWAGSFDRNDADLLDIQAAIADTVAEAVAGRLLPGDHSRLTAQPTRSGAAYDHFLRGSYLLRRRTAGDARAAIREFETATRLDPQYAAAWSRIALAYGIALDWGWPNFDATTSIGAGMSASARALELDSMLADAWTARGYILRFANARTYTGVREAFERALALAPRDAEALLQYGWALANLGADAAAVDALRRAIALDPELSVSRYTLGMTLIIMGRAAEALPVLDTVVAADPTAENLHGMRAWARLLTGDTAGARADLLIEHDAFAANDAARAMLAARTGDSALARAIAERLAATQPAAPQGLTWNAGWAALALAATGQAARAVDLLGRIDPQGLPAWLITRHPGFDAIRADPRFVRLTAALAPGGTGR